MKLSSFMKSVLIFGAGVLTGAYYMHTRMRSEYQAFADEQINDIKDCYKEKEEKLRKDFEDRTDKMNAEVEEKATKMGIDYALHTLNLQNADGTSIYDTKTSMCEIIKPEEFGKNDDYSCRWLTYYADGWLADDEGGSLIDDVDRFVGPNAIRNIGRYTPDIVHVRNHMFHKDYEIARSLSNFSDIYGWDPADRANPDEDIDWDGESELEEDDD